ncbi:hypothetical protein [Micromonospora carbonacea]|uniref:Uncharacterized protein n=1 Tax=Micromonospora carbonacea TaxID=47853 RepID=A0A1C5AKZ8_9ACTN|nr:hypothetical protein [Micromonospora carbonacea]SCF45741.1 hypothetical protein GA0070563_11428 [Micromonospora carbonacea]
MDLALCLGLSAVGGASVVVARWLRGRSPVGAARGSGPGPDPGSRQGTAARGLPADLEERLARFGRFTFDPGGGDTDADEELYSQFGTNLQTPPFWCHPELEPYFPLPAPRLD